MTALVIPCQAACKVNGSAAVNSATPARLQHTVHLEPTQRTRGWPTLRLNESSQLPGPADGPPPRRLQLTQLLLSPVRNAIGMHGTFASRGLLHDRARNFWIPLRLSQRLLVKATYPGVVSVCPQVHTRNRQNCVRSVAGRARHRTPRSYGMGSPSREPVDSV